MSTLIQYWKNVHFTDLLLFTTIVCAFVISILKRRNHSQFKFFPFYLGAFAIFQLEFYFTTIFFNEKHPYYTKLTRLGLYIDASVTLTEFFAFMYFFFQIIKNEGKRNLIKWLTIVGMSIGILFF